MIQKLQGQTVSMCCHGNTIHVSNKASVLGNQDTLYHVPLRGSDI